MNLICLLCGWQVFKSSPMYISQGIYEQEVETRIRVQTQTQALQDGMWVPQAAPTTCHKTYFLMSFSTANDTASYIAIGLLEHLGWGTLSKRKKNGWHCPSVFFCLRYNWDSWRGINSSPSAKEGLKECNSHVFRHKQPEVGSGVSICWRQCIEFSVICNQVQLKLFIFKIFIAVERQIDGRVGERERKREIFYLLVHSFKWLQLLWQ